MQNLISKIELTKCKKTLQFILKLLRSSRCLGFTVGLIDYPPLLNTITGWTCCWARWKVTTWMVFLVVKYYRKHSMFVLVGIHECMNVLWWKRALVCSTCIRLGLLGSGVWAGDALGNWTWLNWGERGKMPKMISAAGYLIKY